MRASRRNSLICMFDFPNVGIISSPSICNGRRGGLQFNQPARDLKKMGSAVETALDSESLSPVMILGDEIS